MTTYVYETIPQKPGDDVVYFEFQQSMKDAPLERHPESGVPVRRVMLGGYGVLSRGGAGPSVSDAGHSCGSGCGCHTPS